MPTKYRSTLPQYDRGSLIVMQSRANGAVRNGKLRKKGSIAPSVVVNIPVTDNQVEPIGFSWEKPSLPRGIVIADKYLTQEKVK